MTQDSSLGLVVVGYESEEEWEPFFRSLKNSLHVPRHIVIVDNSPQTTEKLTHRYGIRFRSFGCRIILAMAAR